MTHPPSPDEYGPPYAGYVARVPAGVDIVEQLAGQLDDTAARLRAVPEERGSYRYAPGKWSVKDVVAHLTDVERVMAYRALRIGRGDPTPLPGFDESAYAAEAAADRLPLAALVDAFAQTRRCTLDLFRQLPPAAWDRRGSASGFPVSVRALGFILVGHELHHLGVLAERYALWDASAGTAR
jgi:hypothetical protein